MRVKRAKKSRATSDEEKQKRKDYLTTEDAEDTEERYREWVMA
jgi:hypothetical protein